MPVKQIERHILDDIQMVSVSIELQSVNFRGEAIGLPTRDRHGVKRGYTCIRCKVDFQEWDVAQEHLHDMQGRENRAQAMELVKMVHKNKGGRKRNRAHIIPAAQTLDIIRFTRDILGITVSEQRARMVAVLLRNPTKIPPASQVQDRSLGMRIAAEYKEVKGLA